MAISSYGSNVNRIVRTWSGNGKSLFEDGKAATSTSSSWYQGDLCWFDTGNHIINSVASTANASAFIGIADNYVSSGVIVGPYTGLTLTNASVNSPGFVGPKYGVVASLVINTGDSPNIGSPMYLLNGGNTQQVTTSDPGDHNSVGVFVGPAAISTATAGQQGYVLLGARFPNATNTGLYF